MKTLLFLLSPLNHCEKKMNNKSFNQLLKTYLDTMAWRVCSTFGISKCFAAINCEPCSFTASNCEQNITYRSLNIDRGKTVNILPHIYTELSKNAIRASLNTNWHLFTLISITSTFYWNESITKVTRHLINLIWQS